MKKFKCIECGKEYEEANVPTSGICEDIDSALKQMGLSGKKMISTPTSEEAKDVDKTSPIKAFKGFK